MLDISNKKGSEFEKKVGEVLFALEKKHKTKIKITMKPKIIIDNSITKIPDFELEFNLEFAIFKELIECQCREKSNCDIINKIYYMNGKTNRNIFTFVFEDGMKINKSTIKAFKNAGINFSSFEDFKIYIKNLSDVLDALKKTNLKYPQNYVLPTKMA